MASRLFALMLAFAASTAFGAAPELPSFAEKLLETQFPKFEGDTDSLSALRRYRTQLEFFREEILEGYNAALQEHVASLGEFDKTLELKRKRGEITKQEYQESHNELQSEYRKAGREGAYLRTYFIYLSKYQSEAKWTISEIRRKEAELLKF